MIRQLEGFIKDIRIRRGVFLDIGSGYGRGLESLTKFVPEAYIIGLDLDVSKLMVLKERVKAPFIDVVYGDASKVPIRSEGIDLVSMFMTLHEIDIRILDDVLGEVWRVLKGNKYFIIVDKVRDYLDTPAEKLTVLIEEAYHKAKKYVYGHQAYGVRSLKETVSRMTLHNFKLVNQKIIKYSEWMSGREFVRRWGRETLSLYEKIIDRKRKEEIGKLINKIRVNSMKYGYGPVKALVILLIKSISR